tara:strand:+ start:389 stop:1252 length:864 start_codon:yes stop_codon:yes gene_type:complete
MNVFITGSSGKVGGAVANFLIGKKVKCYLGLRNNKSNFKNSKVCQVVKADILSKNFRIPNDCKMIIHTATGVKKNFNSKKIYKDFQMSKKIFQLAEKEKNIKKVIFLSTAAIYSKKNKIVNEKTRQFNNDIYSRTKIKCEKLFLRSKEKKIYNVRIPAVIGTYKEQNFFTKLVTNIYSKKKFDLYNPNQKFNNILDIQSLNQFLFSLLKSDFNSGNILIGSKKPMLLKDVVNIIKKKLKKNPKIQWKKNKDGFYLDIRKSIKNYKFKPRSTFKTIVRYINLNYGQSI